ncbi:MAG: hypothetical protein AAF756_18960 [Pseudomonadota bacterium]
MAESSRDDGQKDPQDGTFDSSGSQRFESPESDDLQSIERLRDRTDELELIISSLTIFALFTIPGWVFENTSVIFTHLSTAMVIIVGLAQTIITGVCYVLAACFVVHLLARGYWVGLIGLRAAFPVGINWDKTRGLGPQGRRHYQRYLPNLDTVISRADRFASSLFAVISMLTLSVLWFGLILIATITVSGVVGARFGHTNLGILVGTGLLFVLFAAFPILNYLLDAQLAYRRPILLENRNFCRLLDLLRGISGLAYPQRLILPVQLTLQSNLGPFGFSFGLGLAILFIVFVGKIQGDAWRQFSLSDEFVWLDDNAARQGVMSAFYEDMPNPRDRLRPWPRLKSFEQNGALARLFLPYFPLRDNLILERLCGSPEDNPDTAQCLRRLWSVELADQIVPMSSFQVAQRDDLQMRGLIGVVPLGGLQPGLHELRIVWNPEADPEAAPVDDRYDQTTVVFNIPFVFSPSVELSPGWSN